MVIKKIASAGALALAVMLAAGCASTPTGTAADTAAYQQAVEAGLPEWANQGGFPSRENKNGGYWKGPIAEDGWFYVGEGNYGDVKLSTRSAELDAKSKIAQYVKSNISDGAKEKLTGKELEVITSSISAITISGIRRVDRFVAKDGTVYVLMFVSTKEVDKAMKEVLDVEYYALVDAILYVEKNE